MGSVNFPTLINATLKKVLITPPTSTVSFGWQILDTDGEICAAGSVPGGNSSYLLADASELQNAKSFNIVGASIDGNGWKVSAWTI